jgi:hypothetical protein
MGRIRSILLCLAFVMSCTLFAGAQSFSRTAVADVNGDGKPDVLILDPTANTAAVYLNTGNGTLGPGAFFGFFPPASGESVMVLSDRNGDGSPDILILQPQQIQTLFGDGSGNFSVPTAAPISFINSSSNVVYADLNGDGLPDLAFGNPVQFVDTNPVTPPIISLIFADGHGGFLPPSALTLAYNTFDIGIGPTSLLVADVNNDGNSDLIIGDGLRTPTAFAGSPYLALNDGTGNFKIVPLGGNTTIEATGDFNGDGKLDLMLGAGDGFGPTILFGDGQGGILFSRSHSLSANSLSFLTDFDLSGTLDVILGATFLPGNGHGDFGDPISFAASLPANIIVVTDMDGDGKPDLVLNTNPPSIVLNTTVALPITASTSFGGAVSAASSNIGQSVTFAAHALSGGGIPVGTVTFDNGGTPISVPLNVYGWASFDSTFTTSGTQSVAANFVGGADPATATSFGNASGTFSTFVLNSPPLLPAPTVSFTMSPNPARQFNPVTLTATVRSPSGTPTGFVIFRADGEVIGSADVGSSANVVFPNPGLHNITASYGGDGTFPSATSPAIVEDIRALNAVRSATTTQLAITAPTFPSTAFTFLASLQGVSNPSGNFVYRISGAVLGVFPGGKPATFAVSTPGTYTASAEYQGDAAFLPSITTANFVLNPPRPEFTLTSSASTLTVKAGQSPIYNITLTPFNGFAETTTFSCSGLPSGAACSFNPSSITTDSTQISLRTALTLSTTAAAIAVPHQRSGTFPPAALPVFAVLLCGLLWTLALTQRSTRARLMVASSTAVLALVLLAGCGGGGSGPAITPTPTPGASPTPTATPSPSPTPTPSQPTPPGTYNFTVTATSATVTHTISLTVVVQ